MNKYVSAIYLKPIDDFWWVFRIRSSVYRKLLVDPQTISNIAILLSLYHYGSHFRKLVVLSFPVCFYNLNCHLYCLSFTVLSKSPISLTPTHRSKLIFTHKGQEMNNLSNSCHNIRLPPISPPSGTNFTHLRNITGHQNKLTKRFYHCPPVA